MQKGISSNKRTEEACNEMKITEATKSKEHVKLIILGYYNKTGSIIIRRSFSLCILLMNSDESCINL